MEYKTRLRAARLVLGSCLSLVLFAACAPVDDERPSSAHDAIAADLMGYIQSNYRSPEDYIVSKFEGHDIVFLGESHYVAQNLEFLGALLPHLHAAGVYNLGWEFANYEDQEKIDRLITAPTYDEALAHDIMAHWSDYHRLGLATDEYIGVYRAAWRLNSSLPAGVQQFRIVALNMPEPYGRAELGKDYYEYDVRDRAHGGSFYNTINIYWAQIIDRELIQKDEKALIYSGSGHTSTRFYQDRLRPKADGVSAGNLIYQYIYDRTLRLSLHGSAFEQSGVQSSIEEVIESLPEEYRRVGFDVVGAPAGAFPIERTGYVFGEGKSTDLTLSDYTDGYVYIAAACDFRPVSLIEGFVTDDTLSIIQPMLAAAKPREEPYTIEEVDEMRKHKWAEGVEKQKPWWKGPAC